MTEMNDGEVVYNRTGGIVECPVPKSVRECAIIAARAAHDKKALDVMIQDVRELTSETDYFVIATASNSRQVNAIVDYGEFVVHVFQPEARDYYRLEELWNDAPTIDLSQEEGFEE